MGKFVKGDVVVVPFPFSDLTASKKRPALVVAALTGDDVILCQITSSPYSDARAIEIAHDDFLTGSLHHISYARPGKLFTANQSLMVSQVGVLKDEAFKRVVNAVVDLLQANLPP